MSDYYTYADFRNELKQDAAREPHKVTDLRTKKKQETPAAPKPRKKKRRSKTKSVAFVLCLFILLLSVVLLFADFLFPTGVAGYVTETFAPAAPCVYAISAGACSTLGEARALSDGVRKMGGAGFIAFDGKYNVLLSAYPTQSEAQAVAQKNGYTVYPIVTKGLSASDFPLAYRAKVKDLLDYHLEIYQKLYDLSDQLAQNGTNVAYCKQRIFAIKEGLEARAEPFLNATETATDAPTMNYRSSIIAVIAALQNLNATQEATFLSDLRWTYIMLLRINRV